MDKTVYMFGNDESGPRGPFSGNHGVDFEALKIQYRTMKYAEAAAIKDDYCWITEDGFIDWLLEEKILSPVTSQFVNSKISTTGEDKYVPSHWPCCPECEQGRGEEDFGRVKHALNRREEFLRCSHCNHTWNHRDEPYLYNKPMLEDDGRYTEGGCVPYSISKTGNVSMDDALKVCTSLGWAEGLGLESYKGVEAARMLGLNIREKEIHRMRGKLTMKRLLETLCPSKNYIIETRGHWLPIVAGQNIDPAETSMRSEVLNCWEVSTQ